jgi:hypothetical protein
MAMESFLHNSIASKYASCVYIYHMFFPAPPLVWVSSLSGPFMGQDALGLLDPKCVLYAQYNENCLVVPFHMWCLSIIKIMYVRARVIVYLALMTNLSPRIKSETNTRAVMNSSR